MPLTPVTERFILHWGEMGPKWGVSRSVAQIHALLYLSDKPLTAEDIADTLTLARSNVSTSIRELIGWGVVRQTTILGDRRDHYESIADVWEMFRLVLAERHKREIEPTLRLLRECADACDSPKESKHIATRIRAIRDFFETSDSWYRSMRNLPDSAIKAIMRLGGKITSFLPRQD